MFGKAKNIAMVRSYRESGYIPKVIGPCKAMEVAAEARLVMKNHEEFECSFPETNRSTFLMVFSPDGKMVASTHGNHNVYITDFTSGRHIKTLSGHPRTPWCIAFHPTCNQILASGCLAGQVRVWDLHGGSEIWNSESQTVIASLTFHPTDKVLVIASYNEIYFWDWTQEKPFAKCRTNNEKEKVRYVSFDQYGHKLITGISNAPKLHSQWDRVAAPQPPPVYPSDHERRITICYRYMIEQYEQLVERYVRLSNRAYNLLPEQSDNNQRRTTDRGTDPMETAEPLTLRNRCLVCQSTLNDPNQECRSDNRNSSFCVTTSRRLRELRRRDTRLDNLGDGASTSNANETVASASNSQSSTRNSREKECLRDKLRKILYPYYLRGSTSGASTSSSSGTSGSSSSSTTTLSSTESQCSLENEVAQQSDGRAKRSLNSDDNESSSKRLKSEELAQEPAAESTHGPTAESTQGPTAESTPGPTAESTQEPSEDPTDAFFEDPTLAFPEEVTRAPPEEPSLAPSVRPGPSQRSDGTTLQINYYNMTPIHVGDPEFAYEENRRIESQRSAFRTASTDLSAPILSTRDRQNTETCTHPYFRIRFRERNLRLSRTPNNSLNIPGLPSLSNSPDLTEPSNSNLSHRTCPRVEWSRPSSRVEWSRPSTRVEWSRPSTRVEWSRPSTRVEWSRPSTRVEWSIPSSRVEWSRPSSGDEWSRASSGDEWSRPSSGDDWSRASSGDEWSRPSSGVEWSRFSSGAEWSRPSSGRFTLMSFRRPNQNNQPPASVICEKFCPDCGLTEIEIPTRTAGNNSASTPEEASSSSQTLHINQEPSVTSTPRRRSAGTNEIDASLSSSRNISTVGDEQTDALTIMREVIRNLQVREEAANALERESLRDDSARRPEDMQSSRMMLMESSSSIARLRAQFRRLQSAYNNRTDREPHMLRLAMENAERRLITRLSNFFENQWNEIEANVPSTSSTTPSLYSTLAFSPNNSTSPTSPNTPNRSAFQPTSSPPTDLASVHFGLRLVDQNIGRMIAQNGSALNDGQSEHIELLWRNLDAQIRALHNAVRENDTETPSPSTSTEEPVVSPESTPSSTSTSQSSTPSPVVVQVSPTVPSREESNLRPVIRRNPNPRRTFRTPCRTNQHGLTSPRGRLDIRNCGSGNTESRTPAEDESSRRPPSTSSRRHFFTQRSSIYRRRRCACFSSLTQPIRHRNSLRPASLRRLCLNLGVSTSIFARRANSLTTNTTPNPDVPSTERNSNEFRPTDLYRETVRRRARHVLVLMVDSLTQFFMNDTFTRTDANITSSDNADARFCRLISLMELAMNLCEVLLSQLDRLRSSRDPPSDANSTSRSPNSTRSPFDHSELILRYMNDSRRQSRQETIRSTSDTRDDNLFRVRLPVLRVNDGPVPPEQPRSSSSERVFYIPSIYRPRYLHPRYFSPVYFGDTLNDEPLTERNDFFLMRADKNVVVNDCKIHNDASVDISKDGKFLVTLLSSGRLNVTTMLGVYSLEWDSLGHCLYTTSFEQNAVSVSLSPTTQHLIVGFGSRRISFIQTDRTIIAQIFKLEGSKSADDKSVYPVKGKLVGIRDLEMTREASEYTSVNCIRWAPTAGEGFVYATNAGKLKILR